MFFLLIGFLSSTVIGQFVIGQSVIGHLDNHVALI